MSLWSKLRPKGQDEPQRPAGPVDARRLLFGDPVPTEPADNSGSKVVVALARLPDAPANRIDPPLQDTTSAPAVNAVPPPRPADTQGAIRAPEPPAVAAAPEPPKPAKVQTHPDDAQFRTPAELSVTPLPVERALVIGSCFSNVMPLYLGHAFGRIQADHILYNHAGTLPEAPPHPLEAYGFQLIMLALRTVLPEQLYFRLNYNDVEGHAAAFRQARERLLQMLHGALAYREQRQIITFVANYMVPQQNPMGRLLPRYDLRNPVYFVEQLNRVIAEEIAGMANVHLLDIDQISANFGRKYIQDDVIWLTTHHGIVSDYDLEFDKHRLEPPLPISATQLSRGGEFVVAVCRELQAMYRTLHQADQVKLVIVDLDDTLWRGVVAEEGLTRPGLTEGWPVGLAEALIFLKKRGVLLAIVSKNDEERIHTLWRSIYGSRLELSDFASVKINWNPKSDNIEQILKEVNLLPRSTVFVDDNPAERAHVAASFKDMRVLGAQPYQLRRILLWAAETQVAYVTDESARRTEMVQAQVLREDTRSRLSRSEFLETLEVKLRLFPVRDAADSRFARAFELINKSNQFNTTGRRWTMDECQAAFAADITFWAFEVDDRFTQYGIVGVAIAGAGCIEQFVMSCRVVGMEVEIAVLAALVERMSGPVSARLVPTDANFLCRDLYARCGFVEVEGEWRTAPGGTVARPAHIGSLELNELMVPAQ